MYLALLSFAILKPSDWSDVAVFCVLGKAVEVPPATPVSAEAFIAVMMTSNYVIVIFLIITSTYHYVVQTISSPIKVLVFRGLIIVSSKSSR